MPYYIRVLGRKIETPSIDVLREAASPALLECTEGTPQDWTELLLKHPSGEPIATIERNPIDAGLGADEIEEFVDECDQLLPATGAAWLKEYLPSIQVIYAFQLHAGTDINSGWERLHAVHAKTWNIAGGILQSDGEGFTNDEGYTIVWQFSDRVDGSWAFAVLTGSETWTSFRMELGNRAQRDSFLRGDVPAGATIVT